MSRPGDRSHLAEMGDVTGRAIAGGHFFPERNAGETISELHPFFE
jgi:hypothetical protein